MIHWLWAATALCGALALCGIGLGLLLARRYHELHAALLAGGIIRERSTPSSGLPAGQWLPAPGTPVPADLVAVCTDGSVLRGEDFAGPDVIVAFLASSCPPCTAALPGLRQVLAGVAPGQPRPVVVLIGPAQDCAGYEAALAPLARVVQDGDAKTGGVTPLFGVRSYPAVLIVGGAQVRTAGMTVADVELPAASLRANH
jgi:hypothetical protein